MELKCDSCGAHIKNISDARMICILIILMGFGFVLGYIVGESMEQSKMRDNAVKAGYAEYYLDSNFERQWRWKGD